MPVPPFFLRLVRLVGGARVARSCRWIQIRERCVLLLAQFGVRERFARDHLIAHGGVVDEDGFDRGDLLQVAGLQVLVGVHVGVVRAGFVVGVVLNELEAGDADGVEGEMVGAAGVLIRDGGDAEVGERGHPLLEDVEDGAVVLRVDAANFSGAVVDVEVGGDQFLLGLDFERARGLADEFGQVSSDRERWRADSCRNVGWRIPCCRRGLPLRRTRARCEWCGAA